MRAFSVVDAHVHVGPPRYRPFEHYRQAMAESGVSGAVLVQQLGHGDNRYLVEAIRRDAEDHDGRSRFAGVGIAATIEDAASVLDGGCVGLRVPPGGLADASGTEVFDLLHERAAVASIHGDFRDVVSSQFTTVVADRPGMRVRLEHLGWFRYGPGQDDVRQFDRLLEMAGLPSVTVMWSGFFANAATPYPYPDAMPYLERTLEAFGSQRIMWSGDWNRAGLATGEYDAAINLALRWGLDKLQLEDVMSRTAARVFGIDLREDEHVA
jgi:L-fuconolactonase